MTLTHPLWGGLSYISTSEYQLAHHFWSA